MAPGCLVSTLFFPYASQSLSLNMILRTWPASESSPKSSFYNFTCACQSNHGACHPRDSFWDSLDIPTLDCINRLVSNDPITD